MSYVYVKVETHARPAARSTRAAAAVATLGTHWFPRDFSTGLDNSSHDPR
jgi:hypothetical protein